LVQRASLCHRQIILKIVVRGSIARADESPDVEPFPAPFLNLEVASIVFGDKQDFVSSHTEGDHA
jgi:hypothetical protein